MEDFLLVTILIVLFIRWLILSNRLSELKLRIDNIIEKNGCGLSVNRRQVH